jgi:hypothetical protein
MRKVVVAAIVTGCVGLLFALVGKYVFGINHPWVSFSPTINITPPAPKTALQAPAKPNPAPAPPPKVRSEWRSGFGQGYLELSVSYGPGNQFSVSCDEGATDTGERTSIRIEILGRAPPPRSKVSIVVEGEEVSLFTDQFGTINTDCRACAANFRYLWERLVPAQVMFVQLSDGRSSKFSVVGANEALSGGPCRTSW